MKKSFIYGVLLILFVAGIYFILPQQAYVYQEQAPYAVAPAPTGHTKAIEKAKERVQKFMAEQEVPGFAIAVSVDGQIVWSEGFGYANIEHHVAATPQTLFRIGSVSKSVTAAAIGLLYEQGKLDLDAPVQKYAPSFPEKKYPVTTRQLGGHLAGIRHYRGQEFMSSKRYETVLEGLEIFKDDSLLYEPGERYSYTSYGWNLISAVVEGASGQDFLEYMRENVFQRTGMRYTFADYHEKIIYNRTSFYHRNDDNKIYNAPYVDNSYKWAGGGFISTVEDLIRFGNAHLQPGFLKKETLDLLFTSQKTNDGKDTGYGIGWRSGADDNGKEYTGHSGGSMGGTAYLALFPEDKLVIAQLANLSGVSHGNMAHEIAAFFYEQK